MSDNLKNNIDVVNVDDEEADAINNTVSIKKSSESNENDNRGFVSRLFANKRILLITLAGVLIFSIGGSFTYLRYRNKDNINQTDTHKQAQIGAEISVADGVIEISKDNVYWKVAKVSDQVKEGYFIKTDATGRAIVALDDGSSVRVSSSSSIKLQSLNPGDIKVRNLTGDVYTRVVKSDRKFSVLVEEETYQALGTAYRTVNKPDSKGLEVYHSKVEAKKLKQTIPEGKQILQFSSNKDLQNKVIDIPADQLIKDEFLKWNLEQDKNSSEFKDKLGYFAILEKSSTPAPATPSTVPAPTVSGLSLSGYKIEKGVRLSWSVGGLSVPKGFKIVKSLSPNPVFGRDDAVYISNSSQVSYDWTIKDGKTYNFRVCVYDGSGCSNYSNNIAITAPKYEASSEPAPSGSLTLIHAGGNSFTWQLSGSAPYGYKLVYSESTKANPSYPGDNPQFFGAGSTSGSIGASSGSYNVRVCMYYKGSCVNYSNQVTVNL
ncbi:FecR domain-containing protein [Candidatus Nomurabacteria bacterium]|nr:FecR domain-containing protein [Candidatus Nomurabacteria bacterium]